MRRAHQKEACSTHRGWVVRLRGEHGWFVGKEKESAGARRERLSVRGGECRKVGGYKVVWTRMGHGEESGF